MRLQVVAQTQQDFADWVAGQQQPPAPAGAQHRRRPPVWPLFNGSADAPAAIRSRASPAASVGPNLTHFKSRSVFAGAIFAHNDPNLRAWLRNPPAQKPGAVMPDLGLTEAQITDLIAYLDTLK